MASEVPSSSPTPFAGVPADGFQNWGIGEVLVNGLRVRTEPGSDAPPVLVPDGDRSVAWVLNEGDQVLVTGGGRAVDGYQWWEVFGALDRSTMAPLRGFVANGPPTDRWIQPANDLGCLEEPTFADLVAMPPHLRLACYGSAPLTFVAYAWTVPEDAGLGGACFVEEPERQHVAWLLCDNINYAWVNATGNGDWTFLLHFNPLVLPEPDWPDVEGRRLTISGHFDDPASSDCGAGLDDPDEQSLAYWTCAMLFVVDALTVG